MSGNLVDIRRRIKSVKNTQKITRAMKTVAAAKLRRSLMELNKTKPLIEKYHFLLSRLAKEIDEAELEFLRERESGIIILVVLSADKGLCGGFNTHIFRFLEEYNQELADKGEKVEVVAVGNKVVRFCQKKEYPLKKYYDSLMMKLKSQDAFELAEYLLEIFLKEEIKRMEFVYTDFISPSKQSVCVQQFLPVKTFSDQKSDNDREIEYIFEPSAQGIFSYILNNHIKLFVYQILLKSLASEHGARMIAMDLASRNADDMIKDLTLNMNKLRQASITKELLEIITATEALRKEDD